MNKNFSAIIVAAVLVVILVFANIGVNNATAPVIEANNVAAAGADLIELMPDASGFTPLYSASLEENTIPTVPETVTAVYQENSGLGYVIKLSTCQGYTKEPIEFTVAIGADGLISNVRLDAYPETKDFGKETYPQTYIGQDSALGGVELVSGVTFSSSAFRNAVIDAFSVLTENGLVAAGQKSDEQILTELITFNHTGFVYNGNLQLEEIAVSGEHITNGFRALNDSGVAYYMNDNGTVYLALVNNSLCCKLFDLSGAEVENDALKEEAVSAAASVFTEKDNTKRFKKLTSKEASFEPLSLDGIFTTVTEAYTITDAGNTYYGFTSAAYAYGNQPVNYYYVIDENGAIYGMNAEDFFLEEDYFTGKPDLDKGAYKDGFKGLTINDDLDTPCVITGATMSTNAAKISVRDALAAFESVKNAGGVK
ncbi:MAG: FMN-binding protein [Eubacteriales bacterium]|nr:FMN-binding protein [Eubacteriales bacterium]